MEVSPFKMSLYLPAQGASEVEVTLIEWHLAEGDRFKKGQALVQIDSAKSVFDFEAPCDGLVLRRFHLEGETLPLTDPIMEIETTDSAMLDWIPPAAAVRKPRSTTGNRPKPCRRTTRFRADRLARLRRLSAATRS